MKHIQYCLFFISLFFSISLKAQQNHFIYIQTDNKQPFYVKVDKSIYSSSFSGHLIIAKLKSGNYALVVGFPKNEWPEQTLHCTVEDKDLGYLLKNFGGKGWGLYNLQSLAVSMADGQEKKSDVAVTTKSDAFSNLLSTVVNDSTIRQNDVAREEIKKPVVEETKAVPTKVSDPVKPGVAEAPKIEPVADMAVISKEEMKKTVTEAPKTVPPIVSEPVKPGVAEGPKAQPVADVAIIAKEEIKKPVAEETTGTSSQVSAPPKPGLAEVSKVAPIADAVVISKKLSKKTAKGMEIVYLETGGGLQDTINIFIPADDEIVQSKQVNLPEETKVKEDVNTKQLEPVQPGETKKETKFLAIDLPNPNSTVSEVKTDTMVKQSNPKGGLVNSDCKIFATDEDFLKLRKKMAAAENTDDMIGIAKKVLKTKCFTTEQVKNLSVLFLSDNGKYDFFDASYPYVSDAKNFETLEGQLTDSYYINRFKVMIRH
jgi:hypothetical protein